MKTRKFENIAERIEDELERVLGDFGLEPFSAIQPALLEPVQEFLLRRGKRLRPKLFIYMNSAYSPEEPPGIYDAAISLELLHNFILIHDDIVDQSDYRRGKPSLHTVLGECFKSIKTSGISAESMAMIIGDLVYAYATSLFLGVDVSAERKVDALRYLTDTALYTAVGELCELTNTFQPFEELTLESIMQASQWKTAYYSFVCPMATGALLGGAPRADVRVIAKFGLQAGLAYQIRDDILDVDADGPSSDTTRLNDIRDGKQTLPIWHTINNAGERERNKLLSIMRKENASAGELQEARDIIVDRGGVIFAKERMREVLFEAEKNLNKLEIATAVKDAVWSLIAEMFDMPRMRRKEEAGI